MMSKGAYIPMILNFPPNELMSLVLSTVLSRMESKEAKASPTPIINEALLLLFLVVVLIVAGKYSQKHPTPVKLFNNHTFTTNPRMRKPASEWVWEARKALPAETMSRYQKPTADDW